LAAEASALLPNMGMRVLPLGDARGTRATEAQRIGAAWARSRVQWFVPRPALVMIMAW